MHAYKDKSSTAPDGSSPASPKVGYRPEDIFPKAMESSTCNDGVDDDCDGQDDVCPVD